jgi:hypothetical protein
MDESRPEMVKDLFQFILDPNECLTITINGFVIQL